MPCLAAPAKSKVVILEAEISTLADWRTAKPNPASESGYKTRQMVPAQPEVTKLATKMLRLTDWPDDEAAKSNPAWESERKV